MIYPAYLLVQTAIALQVEPNPAPVTAPVPEPEKPAQQFEPNLTGFRSLPTSLPSPNSSIPAPAPTVCPLKR
jgi:hypothetical protein